MENNIEETKKQLELILKVRKEQKEIIECAGESCMNCNPDIKALSESIDILSDYKRILKENEELKENCNIDYKRESEVLALQLHLLREEAKTTEKDYNMLKEYYKEQNEVNARFIPVQRIKDKIDKLQGDLKYIAYIACKNNDCNKCFTEYRGSNFVYCYAYHQIKVLNELLESEE